MRRLLRRAFLCLSVAAAVTPAAAAQDWPEFRGPTGQGHSAEQGVPLEWSESRNVAWKTPVPGSGWSSPVVASGRVIRVGDRDEVISVGAYRAEAYDPLTGKAIWRVAYDDGFSNVPRPVYGHGLVYIATGFQQPSLLAVRADGTGDVTKTHVPWTLRRAAPYTPSPLVVGDALYVVNDAGIASCLDATTGTVRWVQRLGGSFSASPVYADGRIYLLSEDGVATVIEPGTTFRLLALNRLDGATLASMAVSRKSIFIRSDTHLYRISASH